MSDYPVVKDVVLQSAVTTGNGEAHDIQAFGREVCLYLHWAGTVSAGAIQVETTDDLTGTWAPLGPPIAGETNSSDVVQITGCHRFIRARVSTAVTGGGTVTVTLHAN